MTIYQLVGQKLYTSETYTSDCILNSLEGANKKTPTPPHYNIHLE